MSSKIITLLFDLQCEIMLRILHRRDQELRTICRRFNELIRSSYVDDLRFSNEKVEMSTAPEIMRLHNAGTVGENVYAFGNSESLQYLWKTYNFEKRSWTTVVVTEPSMGIRTNSRSSEGFGKNVFLLKKSLSCVYDTEANMARRFHMPSFEWRYWLLDAASCVIKNHLIVYNFLRGFVWYDLTHDIWNEIGGGFSLNFNRVKSVGLGELNGKLVIVWTTICNRKKVEVWFTNLTLELTKTGMNGIPDRSHCLTTLDRGYKLDKCLPLSSR